MIQVIIGVVEIILRERTLSRSTDVRESSKAKSFGYVFNTLDTTFKSVLLKSGRIHHDGHALMFQFILLRHKISKCTFIKSTASTVQATTVGSTMRPCMIPMPSYITVFVY